MSNYLRCHAYLFIGAYYPTLHEVPSIRCVDQLGPTGGVKNKSGDILWNCMSKIDDILTQTLTHQ